VVFTDVSFRYPENEFPILDCVSLSIEPGEYFALVGESGAGKTTLVDVMLGIIHPNEGDLRISGLPPSVAIQKWPGAIAYVPQDVQIVEGTIRENVALGFDSHLIQEELIFGALKIAKLDNFVRSLPLGIDTPVGDRGTKLSGGQRQRLGIARAMFTNPRLLILDEATSALDMKTESEFAEALKGLASGVTLVVIAHRISTIESASAVFEIRDGKLTKIR
jgi:ABC-type multidrug transport system fused ATPase/permease subunit